MELHYARVTSKGQITIPAAIRRKLELETGSSVLFLVKTDGEVTFKHPLHDLEQHFGTVAIPAGMADEENPAAGDEDAFAAEAVERYRRSMGLEPVEGDAAEQRDEQRAAAAAG